MSRQPWLFFVGACVIAGCTVNNAPDSGTVRPDANLIPEDSSVVRPDGGIDSGPMCEPGEILCSGACTRVAGDSLNCGSCGVACPEGVSCAAGRCNCEAPRISCDGVCLDPLSDPFHCNGCGIECGAREMCAGGTCNLVCDESSVVCVNRDEAGDPFQLCADLQTDPVNCGRCNTRCAGGSVCREGRCGCPDGQVNCGGTCIDLSTDPNNCGSCRVSCGGGSCEGGRCATCGGGFTDCTGRCVDLLTDRLNCGTCARSCGTGEACSDGLCECTPGLIDCGTGCTNLETDVRNCGVCGIDCGAGGVCAAGECACSTGLTLCSGSCRNLAIDVNHCGGCDDACPALVGGICAGGECGCPAGLSDCGGACIDTQYNRNNCNGCGLACATGEVCLEGTCSSTLPTQYRQETPPDGAVAFVNACAAPGATTVLSMTDDGSVRVPLQFPFRYWSTNHSAGFLINVTSNGWIGFDGGTAATTSGTIPSTSTPNGVMAPHWGDLVTRSGVCVATVGVAPNRRFVVQWPNARNLLGADTNVLNFEIILNENSGIIDFVYETMTGANARTLGIENHTGTLGINACPGGTGTCIPAAGQRVRFVPIIP